MMKKNRLIYIINTLNPAPPLPPHLLRSDTQIKSESFLEDLNNILNSGDVPNIYAFDELDQIYTAMKVTMIKGREKQSSLK